MHRLSLLLLESGRKARDGTPPASQEEAALQLLHVCACGRVFDLLASPGMCPRAAARSSTLCSSLTKAVYLASEYVETIKG